MRSTLGLNWAVLLFMLGCGSAVAQAPFPVALREPAVRMITEAWTPWIFEGRDGSAQGIFQEITREVCRRAGLRYEVKFYPWQRCLNMMGTGGADALLMLEKEPERERYMVYSEPILKDENLVYFHTDAPIQEWNSWADLKGFTIGMTSGYTFGDEFEKAKSKHQLRFDFAMTDVQTITKLVNGRFQVAIVNRTVAKTFFLANPRLAGCVKAAKKPASTALYYIAFSRKSDRLDVLPRMNAAIKAMKAEGIIDKLVYEGLKRQ